MHSLPQGHSALRAHSRHCFSERASRRRSLEASLRLLPPVGGVGSSSVVVAVAASSALFSSTAGAVGAAGADRLGGGGSQYSRLIGQMTVFQRMKREVELEVEFFFLRSKTNFSPI